VNTQHDIKNVQERIVKQQEKLENIELLVKNFFERITHEAFQHTQDKKMLIHEVTDRSAIVIFLLKSIPIHQTVQIQYHLYPQPKGSYFFHKNVVMLFWIDRIASLRERSFIISYVADPTVKDAYNALSYMDGEIHADAKRLVWLSDKGKIMLVLNDAIVTLTMDTEKKNFQISIPKAAAEASIQ
jgi:hypothetical protein